MDWWECEDVAAINLPANRFAIADGATEAFDSRRWAKLLAHGWVRSNPPANNQEQFQEWLAIMGERFHRKWKRRSLPWYGEEKARLGSFAAFLGLQFTVEGGSLNWKGLALGDACLIQLRQNVVCEAFPFADASSFRKNPTLTPSLGTLQKSAIGHLKINSGEAELGDLFLLLSDGVASLYFEALAENDPLTMQLDRLLESSNTDELSCLFDELRGVGRCANDDIAILRVRIGPE